MKTSKGVAKRELKKLLKVSDQHVKDIEAEISEANKAFAEKKSKLEKYEKKDAKQSPGENKSESGKIDQATVQKMLDERNKQMEQKYNDAVSSFDKQLSSLEQKLNGRLEEAKKEGENLQKTRVDQQQAEVETTVKKYKKLSEMHEKEVKELFENVDTLKFVKEMKYFKKQWQDQKTVKKRKKIAAAMANATKGWVSNGEKIE